jgi:hypothetical protein
VARQFTRVQQAWYSQAFIVGEDTRSSIYDKEEFGFSLMEALEDGEAEAMDGEVYVRFQKVGNEQVARLEAFQDGWNLLPHLGDILAKLTDEPDMDADRFQALLLQAGFIDITPREPADERTRAIFLARKQAADPASQETKVVLRHPRSHKH